VTGDRRASGAVDGFYAGKVQLVGARAAGDVGQDIVPNSYVLWVASDAGAATFSVTLAPGARTGAHAVALAVSTRSQCRPLHTRAAHWHAFELIVSQRLNLPEQSVAGFVGKKNNIMRQ